MRSPSILLVAVLFANFCAASPDCNFEQYAELYQIQYAEKDAVKNFIEDRAAIYIVATGFGPSRPGFEEPSKTKNCVLKELWDNQIVLWTGADSIGSCKDKNKAVTAATKYADVHNKKMLELLKESGHPCFELIK